MCVLKTTKDIIVMLLKLRMYNLSSLCVQLWVFVHVSVSVFWVVSIDVFQSFGIHLEAIQISKWSSG